MRHENVNVKRIERIADSIEKPLDIFLMNKKL